MPQHQPPDIKPRSNQGQTKVKPRSNIETNLSQEALPALLAEDGADSLSLLKAPYPVAPNGLGPWFAGDFLNSVEDAGSFGLSGCGGHCGSVGG